MARGGARNRSGPPADPASGRSDRRGVKVTALPAEGWDGDVPDFPLLGPTARERDLWEWAWRTPQACAWQLPSESWRVRTVALWVRLSARCEAEDAAASLLAQLHRFADQIGMTPAGLHENGWVIAKDEIGEKRAEIAAAPQEQPKRVRRLREA